MLALPTGTDDREAKAAYTFAHGDGVKVNLGGHSSAEIDARRPAAQTDDFFGGQKPHAVIAQASKDVRTDFTYLSYTAYANSIREFHRPVIPRQTHLARGPAAVGRIAQEIWRRGRLHRTVGRVPTRTMKRTSCNCCDRAARTIEIPS